MILKLGMQHQGLKIYKVYITDDPGLTLTYFTARSNWVAYTFKWGKTVTSYYIIVFLLFFFLFLFNVPVNTFSVMLRRSHLLYNCVYEKQIHLPWGLIYVYDYYFQTSSSLKLLGQSTPNLLWRLLGKFERKFI